MEKIIVFRYDSPLGGLMLGALGGELCMCDWVLGRSREAVRARLTRLLDARFEEGDSDVIARAAAQLDEYFAGRRRVFDLPLLLAGTDFQRAAWEELRRIPYGTTMSYAEMATRMGVPRAVRAVAGANRVNAISIIVPCHRVIGSDGTLTGYGGGLETKKALLELERK
jgi:methylated-DNA-[protein]-cysteine S-methyltransferase